MEDVKPLKEKSAAATFTSAERLILANQYAILAALFPSRRLEYLAKRRLVETGSVAECSALLPHRARPSSESDRQRNGNRRGRLHNRVNRGGALTPW